MQLMKLSAGATEVVKGSKNDPLRGQSRKIKKTSAWPTAFLPKY